MAFVNTLNKLARETVSRLPACHAGNVLPLTAGAFLVLAGLVGGGVDISRSYMVKNRLQNACDAGALAGRKAVSTNGYNSAAQVEANRFFDINFDETSENVTGTTFITTTPDNGNTVDGVASTDMQTVIMGIFGINTVDLSVNCAASMAVGNSDVMMVLDTTGSMGWNLDGSQTRIQALRTAMKNFYDTIDTATAGSNARVRYGFVPYSTTVNVGSLLPASFLADTVSINTREPEFETVTNTTTTYGPGVASQSTGTSNTSTGNWQVYSYTSYYYSWQCNNALPSDTNWSNNGGSYTSTQTYINGQGQKITQTTTSQDQSNRDYFCAQYNGRYYRYYRPGYRTLYSYDTITQDPITETTTSTEFSNWLYKKRDLDTSTYKTFASTSEDNGSDGASVSYTWDGCIEERGTESESSFSYSSLTGMSPYTWDLDIDSAPTSAQESQWAPLYRQMSYRRGTSNQIWNVTESESGWQNSSVCPIQSQLLATMTESAFDGVADALSPSGNTYHDIGMIWGARLSSPDGIFDSNVTVEPTNGQSVARHIIFMTDGALQPSNTIHSAYGVEYYDQRVTDNGSSSISSRHHSRFNAVCEATKAKGIRVWVIAFATGLTSEMTACASDDSTFLASNANQLNEAFQEIAKDVGELRITQ